MFLFVWDNIFFSGEMEHRSGVDRGWEQDDEG